MLIKYFFRGVAMLNTDTCLNGDLNKKVSVNSSPSLIGLFIKAAKVFSKNDL